MLLSQAVAIAYPAVCKSHCSCSIDKCCCVSVLQLYTAAINACMANDGTNFDAAFEIYAAMQRNGVEPDDLLYGHLIALAGRCKKLEVTSWAAATLF